MKIDVNCKNNNYYNCRENAPNNAGWKMYGWMMMFSFVPYWWCFCCSTSFWLTSTLLVFCFNNNNLLLLFVNLSFCWFSFCFAELVSSMLLFYLFMNFYLGYFSQIVYHWHSSHWMSEANWFPIPPYQASACTRSDHVVRWVPNADSSVLSSHELLLGFFSQINYHWHSSHWMSEVNWFPIPPYQASAHTGPDHIVRWVPNADSSISSECRGTISPLLFKNSPLYYVWRCELWMM